MELRPWKFLFLLSLAFHVDVIASECNVCQSNQAACINSTSFYLCFGGSTPNRDNLYHCKTGFECTDLMAICVQKNNARPPSCGDTSLCGQCSANRNYIFACLSRTTFQMCYGAGRPIGQIGYCPNGYVCDATSNDFCVSENVPHTITCDVVSMDQPSPQSSSSSSSSATTTIATTETATTPSTTTPIYPLTPDQVCAQMREVGLFPTMPHDPYCRRYIYCFYKNGVIRGIEYNCSGNSFYDIEEEMCTLAKPPYCI